MQEGIWNWSINPYRFGINIINILGQSAELQSKQPQIPASGYDLANYYKTDHFNQFLGEINKLISALINIHSPAYTCQTDLL